MLLRLLLLSITLPFCELFLFFSIGQRIGFDLALSLLFLMSLSGLLIMRRQGLRALSTYRFETVQNRVPAQSAINGFLLFLSGVLLFLPGFLTGGAGLFLLLPLTRKLVLGHLEKSLRTRFQFTQYTASATSQSTGGAPKSRLDYIDVEAEVVDSYPSGGKSAH